MELGGLTSTDEDASITVIGYLMMALPLDIYLCRLVAFGAVFGCVHLHIASLVR